MNQPQGAMSSAIQTPGSTVSMTTEETIALAMAALKHNMAAAHRRHSREDEEPPSSRNSREMLADHQPNNPVISTELSHELADFYCIGNTATSEPFSTTSHKRSSSVPSTVAEPKRGIKAKRSSRKRSRSSDGKDRRMSYHKKAVPSSHQTKSLPNATISEASWSVIDEVLDESDDLLRCAYEAQSLGRLSDAQSYLYLAHGRLVGLGRLVEHGNVLDEENGFLKTADTNQVSCVGRMQTPHAERLSLKPKITPSPQIANMAAAQECNLSGYLAQSAQELLYKQRRSGKKNLSLKHNNRSQARVNSVEAKLFADNWEKEKTGNAQEHVTRLAGHPSGSVAWNHSVMTSYEAELDAKVWVKKGTTSSL